MAEKQRYLYQDYSWPELKEVAKQDPVVVLPIASVEDHGRHLPIDTDNFLIWSICEAAAKQLEGKMLLMPLIPYGYETHHMDMPGTIDIRIEHLLHFVTDVTCSVARHGFSRILIADGHGSNMPILDLAARRTILETNALCAAFIWPSLAADVIASVRESEVPGGIAHACELETSVYLYLAEERVRMEEAVDEMGMPESRFIWMDLMKGSPVLMMDHWTRFSRSGTYGQPRLATKEKGRIVFETVVKALVELVHEFHARPRNDRADMH